MTWFLKAVNLSNILGFLGQKQLKFGSGLQVIEAHNHTGKTSLANAILWGLTGKLPAIGRIKNKLARDEENAEIEILLENGNEDTLLIRRLTNGAGKKSQLTVLMNGAVYQDEKAQEIMDAEIGLKAESLEGCSVVLQEQRLSLIAGDLKKSSDIIHDILGLSTLSKLVPIIKDKLKPLNKLIKDFEGKDLLKRWEERHRELTQELTDKEQDAIRKRYDPQIFKTTTFLKDEFTVLCQKLGFQSSSEFRSPNEYAHALKAELYRQRNENPSKAAEEQTSKKLFVVENSLKKIREIKTAAAEIESRNLKLNSEQIVLELQESELKIEAKKAALETLKEQSGLFSHALSLLTHAECGNACPLCEQSVDKESLLKHVENKLGVVLKESIALHESDLKQLLQRKKEIESLKLELTELENRRKTLLTDVISVLNSLGTYQEQISSLQSGQESLLHLLQTLDVKIEEELKSISSEHEKTKSASQNYLQERKLWEDQLDNLVMYLIPIYDVHKKIGEHAKSREERLHSSVKHASLLAETKKYRDQLTELVLFLQTQEKRKANQLVYEHQDFVTDFFVHVADNPYYDKIAITAKEAHGSIKYDFEASSTKTSTLTDSAKQVLSGGDLSTACLGLMLSLTKGKSNKTGFMVLDDPGESFDAIRMANFAKKLSSVAGRQTIILTHQADFAASLRSHGATTLYM